MKPPCCSTCTPPTCGAGSPPTCPGTWPGWQASPARRCKAELRIRYVKVAEYQARGVIHFHAVIRLDAHTKEGFTPPPARYTAALLCDAIALAAKAVRITVPGSGAGHPAPLRPRTRHAAHLAAAVRRHRPRAGSRCGRELHRQVRHQGRRRARPARHPHPARRRNRARCAARPTTSAWSRWRGTSARGPRPVIRGCGCGRTSSASAATRSPNPAATPSPSATSGANASPPGGSSATPTANATPGAAPSMTRVVLVLANWSYAGTGYTPRTSAAELALASADMARAR